MSNFLTLLQAANAPIAIEDMYSVSGNSVILAPLNE
jgi:hypothetical protein